MPHLVSYKPKPGFKCKINITPKPALLANLRGKLSVIYYKIFATNLGSKFISIYRRRFATNQTGMAQDVVFHALLKSDANNPLIISWLEKAKLQNKTRPKPLTEHLYDLWCERNKHFQQMEEKLQLIEKQKNTNVKGQLTASARFHLIICVITLNFYGVYYLHGKPEYKNLLITAFILCNASLCLVYLLRYKLGRGPNSGGNPVVWIFQQLKFALLLGFGVGLFLGTLALINGVNHGIGGYLLANDGLGGMWSVLKAFWADEIPDYILNFGR